MRKLYLRAYALAALCVSVSASAAMLADFEMNDPANTRLPQLQNDAPGGGKFSYGATNMLTDGNGLLVYTYGQGDAAGKKNCAYAPLAAENSSGIYKLSFAIDSATLSYTNGSIQYMIADTNNNKIVSVQFIKNWNRLRLVMQDWNHVDNLTGAGTNSLPDKLYVEVTFDLDNDLADFSWTMGTQTGGYSSVSIGDYSAARLRNLYQPTGMTGSDFIKVDYLKVESIPEPAALALLGFFGGAILFLRRWTRM